MADVLVLGGLAGCGDGEDQDNGIADFSFYRQSACCPFNFLFRCLLFARFPSGDGPAIHKRCTEECIRPVGSIGRCVETSSDWRRGGATIGDMSQGLSLSPLLLAFMIAGLIRIATGSATVALTTAAGIVSPIIASMPDVNLELLVIATGAGSLMFSHVNDAGFWMVKEYLGSTVKETFKTWTVLETVLSFSAFAGVLIVSMFV